MTELRVWAPKAARLEVEMNKCRVPMQQADEGWWVWDSEELQHGADYALWLDGQGPRADPRSMFQPRGVTGPSRWVDHSRFEWQHGAWKPCALNDAVIYELHVGTFTREGTFAAAVDCLGDLKTLGITHVEIMPVAEFPGNRGWGYDGVNLFAPHHCYGGPDALKQLVDACHATGLAVILDVVYNHFGPLDNYLDQFGHYFTDLYKTPWGQAVNLDGPWSHEVRCYFIDNALMWLRDYHIDGLRVDAVHALMDRSAIHFMEQLAREVDTLGNQLGRDFVLIAECDLNDPRYVRPVSQGGLGVDAQWNDDFHHALHTLLTGERFGYYEDYGDLSDLSQTLAAGYSYDGRYSKFRRRRHGRPAEGLDGANFIAYLQNHDQIGNRGHGERIGHLVDLAKQKLGAAVTLLSPFVPMIFQGEEWGASSPFLYFIGIEDVELGNAIREGRCQEFGAQGLDPMSLADPLAEDTWRRSQLKRDERSQSPHAELLQWYRDLIALRRSSGDFRAGSLDAEGVCLNPDTGWLRFRRGAHVVACNFSDCQLDMPCDACKGTRLVLASDAAVTISDDGVVGLPPWSVAVVRR